MPNARQQYFNTATNTPMENGYVYTYAAGTTTPKATYTTAAANVQNANPVRLDARGEATIFWSGSYFIDVRDANNVSVYTQDNYTDPQSVVDTIRSDLAASTGAGLIGWIRSAAGAVAATLSKWLGWQPVSVFDFMTDAQRDDVTAGTATLDVTAAMQAARDHIAGATKKKKLVFPAGVYKYTVSPNWAIQDAEIIAEGEVRLRYFGTGNAVILDAGSGAQLVYNMTMGDFIVECPSTAQNGVYVRSVHHSKLDFNIRGAGTIYAGLLVEFAVVTEFGITCSVNEAGWYLGAKPANGILLDKRGANETVSYCTFDNPVIEGPAIGINLTNTLGNTFRGGTSEACSNYGLFAASTSVTDKFYGTDFEANTTADAYILGRGIELNHCDSDNLINFGSLAQRCIINGGEHGSVEIGASSQHCSATNIKYNRSNNGKTFVDDGTNTFLSNVFNAGSNVRFLTGIATYDPPSLLTGGVTTAVVTVLGAKLGDTAAASFSLDNQLIEFKAAVSAADQVTVVLTNKNAGTIDLASGTLKCVVTRS